MEKWAESETKKILAISADGGWAEFAKDSKWIDVETDLLAAFQEFQQHAEKAERAIASLLTNVVVGNLPDLQEQIKEAVALALKNSDIYAEFSSALQCEADLVYLTYHRHQLIQFGDENEYDFKIVQLGKDQIVVAVGVSINATADCNFALAVWDSIDREYVSMGSRNIMTELEFDCTALITFEGDLSTMLPDVEMSSLELIDMIDSVDFGEIEMDYGSDRYDEDIEV